MKTNEMVTEDIINQAQGAFWAKIVELFPEVQGGDFPPDATFKFDDACKEAIETWLHFNHPQIEQEREFIQWVENPVI